MNLSTAIFLVNKGVRAIKVQYDPDTPKNNNYALYTFKTLDPDLKKDDFVVVPTDTRHGFTVCKVVETDVRVDFNSTIQFKWIVGKVDKSAYDSILEQEEVVLKRVAEAEENRIRAELVKSMGMAEVNFTDLDIVKGSVALPQPSTPRGAGNQVDRDPSEAAVPPDYIKPADEPFI